MDSLDKIIASPQMTWVRRFGPWLAGAGMAVGHLTASSHCSLPKQGQCTTCGGCVIAVASLVGWAALKKKQEDDLDSIDS